MMAAEGGGGSGASIPASSGVVSRYVRVTNMFDPHDQDAKSDPRAFFQDVEDDLAEQAGQYGDVRKCVALRESAGHVLLKFREEEAALRCANALNGRWFSGGQLTATTVEEAEVKELI